MNTFSRRTPPDDLWLLLLLGMMFAAVVIALSGCSTVSPDLPRATQIAFGADGQQDAGLKGEVVDAKTGEKMFLISPVDRDAFNNDVAKFGKRFNPPLTPDEGIVPFQGNFAIRDDMLTDFIEMNALAKQAVP